MAKTRYRLTAARRRALRKAQLVSARKRKGKGKGTKQSNGIRRGVLGATGVIGVAAVTGVYARHKLSGSKLSGPFGSTPTPKSILGTNIGKGTSLTYAPLGRDSAIVSGQIRARGRDKVMFLYEHKKITKAHFTKDNVMKSLFGKKVIKEVVAPPGKLSSKIKALQPDPVEINQDIFRGQNRKAYSSITRSQRKAAGNSVLANIAGSRRINRVEVRRRVQGYVNAMAGRGIIVNQDHILKVTRLFEEQVW